MKTEKWKVIVGEGEPKRYVVDGNNTLIADCYAASTDDVGLPDEEEARKNARRIAMLPEMVALLRRIEGSLPRGCRSRGKIGDILRRYDKLTPKTNS